MSSHFTIYASDFQVAICYTNQHSLLDAQLPIDALSEIKDILHDLQKEGKAEETLIEQMIDIVKTIPVGSKSDTIIDCLVLYNYILLYTVDSESIALQKLHDAIFNSETDFV